MIIGAFLFALVFAGFNIPTARAATIDELQAQIQSLMSQIKALQQQLAQQQGNQGVAWCHNFNTNMGYGAKGTDFDNLITALRKEGIFTKDEADSISYDEFVGSKIVEFQEKYTSEILSPSGLKHGTGFVGKSTRAKLNKLYGCGITPIICTPSWHFGDWSDCINGQQTRTASDLNNCGVSTGMPTPQTQSEACAPSTTQPFIAVISPNGGETWQIGKTYTIKYSAKNIASSDSISIYLQKGYDAGSTKTGVNSSLRIGNTSNLESFDYTVSSNIASWPGLGNNYTVKVCNTNSCTISDSSNNYFSIVDNWDICRLDKLDGTNITRDAIYDKAICLSKICDIYGPANLNQMSSKCVFDSVEIKRYTTTAQPSITVTSPNGGEVLTAGQTYTIKWNTGGFSADSDITLSLSLEGSETPIVKTKNSGNYVWTILTNVKEGKLYKIFIAKGNVSEASILDGTFDASDNYFSIVAAPVGLNEMESQLASISSAISSLIEAIKQGLTQ